jgi:hypothetical protein
LGERVGADAYPPHLPEKICEIHHVRNARLLNGGFAGTRSAGPKLFFRARLFFRGCDPIAFTLMLT